MSSWGGGAGDEDAVVDARRGGSGDESGDESKGERLFRDEFLNSNPILQALPQPRAAGEVPRVPVLRSSCRRRQEYMTQAALEESGARADPPPREGKADVLQLSDSDEESDRISWPQMRRDEEDGAASKAPCEALERHAAARRGGDVEEAPEELAKEPHLATASGREYRSEMRPMAGKEVRQAGARGGRGFASQLREVRCHPACDRGSQGVLVP